MYEDIARDTNRGHTVRAVCESFQLAKDSGFKVVAHMMPDLPNVGLERDVNGFIVRIKVTKCMRLFCVPLLRFFDFTYEQLCAPLF